MNLKTKYGYYSSSQISIVKQSLRKAIFFLLLYVDPQTKDDYPNVNVDDAFQSLMLRLNGLNSILLEPPELVDTMCYLEAARQLLDSNFDFALYRKLILDAGAQIMRIKEVD